jgi:hypothetical protein
MTLSTIESRELLPEPVVCAASVVFEVAADVALSPATTWNDPSLPLAARICCRIADNRSMALLLTLPMLLISNPLSIDPQRGIARIGAASRRLAASSTTRSGDSCTVFAAGPKM